MNTTNITFAYARVSSKDQNLSRQLERFRELGIDDRCIFQDKQSGKDFNRSGYQALLSMLREGDVVYVMSIDRLGRNYNEIRQEWERITKEKKADIVVLDMPLLDTREKKDLTGTFVADLVLQILSYVSAKERENIKTRQAEGIAIAKAEGKYKGRPPIQPDKEKFEKLYQEVFIEETRTAVSAMAEMGVKATTFYKWKTQYDTKTGWWKPAENDQK